MRDRGLGLWSRVVMAVSLAANRRGLYNGPRSAGIHVAVYRWSNGRIGGHLPGFPWVRIVLVDHVGARTGKRRTSPLMCLQDAGVVAVAASKAGQPTHPAWFHNLMAHPDTTIQLAAERRSVRARVASDEERSEWWPKLVAMYPGYDSFQRLAGARTIPVVLLEPQAGDVLIGGPERVAITIADADPAWPLRFASERDRIAAALGPSVAVRIEHIGSTAVPGLAAKPIVDVLVTVADPENEEVFRPALERAGYELRVREPGHRMFRTPQRDVHVHVWADDDPEVSRYLVLRDWLRKSPEDRAAYERLKRDLAARGDWDDMNHYAEAKSELIAELIARAEAS